MAVEMAETAAVVVGATFALAATSVFVFIVSVVATLVRSGFLQRKRNTVYILIFANVVVDAITVFQLCVYLAPSITIQVGN